MKLITTIFIFFIINLFEFTMATTNDLNFNYVDKQGNYKKSSLREIISNEHPVFKPENNRYHIYHSFGCPFSTRVLITLKLKGLENCFDTSVVDYIVNKSVGWAFTSTTEGCTIDRVNNFKTVKEIYQLNDKNYNGRVTLPILFDKKTNVIVNTESSDIMRMLNSEFNQFSSFGKEKIDLYPKEYQDRINEINDFILPTINLGVYKCGSAENQQDYTEKFNILFDALERMEEILKRDRYLVGSDKITESDIKLFSTLIRFDAAYLQLFKCNKRQIKEFPMLSNYTRELYQMKEIQSTINFHHIKYWLFTFFDKVNPLKLVPIGPDLQWLNETHNRHLMSKYY
ncbi:hypothetical protein RB653_005283 [Dictyostelium firmibasis]|uniref:GST N-terminal domain-containing protein n=1 Tax=Dictyostelium firmibasis TaxID=79012 RepID=A0AAN7Z401_9MYCE